MTFSNNSHSENTPEAMIASLHDWWSIAGVDLHYSETPASLLKEKPSPPLPDVSVEIALSKQEDNLEVVTEKTVNQDMPDDYEGFLNWIKNPVNLMEKSWSRDYILPYGKLNPQFMIITALPELETMSDDNIFSVSSKALMDKMIAAMGSDSENCYFAPLAMARSLDGRVPDNYKNGLKARMLHLIGLVQPKKIIVLGDIASKIFFDQDLLSARKKKQFINHVSANTESIATFHPRILIERPQFKADAWNDLQLLLRTVDP